MNLEIYRSDRFGQALFNALLDGFERARVETRLETKPSDLAATPPERLPEEGHQQSEPRQ